MTTRLPASGPKLTRACGMNMKASVSDGAANARAACQSVATYHSSDLNSAFEGHLVSILWSDGVGPFLHPRLVFVHGTPLERGRV